MTPPQGPSTIDIRIKPGGATAAVQAPAAPSGPPAPTGATDGGGGATQAVQLVQTMQIDRVCLQLYQAIRPYTMVDIWAVNSLYRSLDYVLESRIDGALVECGVWRGGCVMFMALLATLRGQTDRDIYLYDTYTGMTEPGEHDVHLRSGDPAINEWRKRQTPEGSEWCAASIEEVRRNVEATGYPVERLHFVKGPVEQTIPGVAPDRIALLRLDTDFYSSTRHELEHLYPRLGRGGVVIFDDYGTWAGQRKAVDEYRRAHGARLLLQCASTSAAGVKLDD